MANSKTKNLIEMYAGLSDEKLTNLYKEKDTLNSAAIPILEEELNSRNLLEGLKAQIQEESPKYNFETEEEQKAFVEARLAEGESLESIRLDLLDHGIDIKKKFKDKFKLEQEIMDYHLKESVEGKPEEEVYKEIKDKYNIEAEEILRIKESQKPTQSLYFGIAVFLYIMGSLTGLVFLFYLTEDETSFRYLLNSGLFFFIAYKSMAKYKILKGEEKEPI